MYSGDGCTQPDLHYDSMLESFPMVRSLFHDYHIRVSRTDHPDGRSTRYLSSKGLEQYRDGLLSTRYEYVKAAPPIEDSLCHDWEEMPYSEEILSDYNVADPLGWFHGRGVHMPLFLQFFSNTKESTSSDAQAHSEPRLYVKRSRGAKGQNSMKVRSAKNNYWKQNGTWPWWLYHSSEQVYWFLFCIWSAPSR